jgi:flagellar protein FliS
MSFGLATRRAASVYAEVGVETGVSTADPHKLILMLFEGALLQIGTAGIAMDNKDIPTKGTATPRRSRSSPTGSRSASTTRQGELAERLGALYDYMTQRLLYANLHNSRPALDEVARLLNELKGAWEEIGTYDQANR